MKASLRVSRSPPVTGKICRMVRKMKQTTQPLHAPRIPPKILFTLPTGVSATAFCTKWPIMNSEMNGMRNPRQMQTSVTVKPLISRLLEMVSASRSFAK